MQYPAEQRCDDAYRTLGDIYEDKGLWLLAVERHENLLLYHPLSPHVPYSEARIPHLRLRSVKSPEYDRKQLIRARAELEAWDHEDPDLKHQVAVDLNDCLRRLTESDLGIARFYRRVKIPAGVEFHAERALETARLADDEGREKQAQKMLDDLPVRVPEPGEVQRPAVEAVP